MSTKHSHRCVYEFVGRHNIRDMNTIDQMENIVAEIKGKRPPYKVLISDADGRMN